MNKLEKACTGYYPPEDGMAGGWFSIQPIHRNIVRFWGRGKPFISFHITLVHNH